MADFTDDDGQPIFTDDFTHRVVSYDGEDLDVIETNGNLWLTGAQAAEAMGFPQHKSGGYGRMLQRIAPPDVIKIKDTPFRFTDGRRNGGSLVSPRAIFELAYGKKTQGQNPFKAWPFAEWIKETLLPDGTDAEAWSPARKAPETLEPVFRKVVTVVDEDEQGRPLDPLRPTAPYHGLADTAPIQSDEVEFCLCPFDWDGLGKCWCGGKGGVRSARPAPFVPYDGDEVIDGEDDFGVFQEPPHAPAKQTMQELLEVAANF